MLKQISEKEVLIEQCASNEVWGFPPCLFFLKKKKQNTFKAMMGLGAGDKAEDD